jgi:hypothetical protein
MYSIGLFYFKGAAGMEDDETYWTFLTSQIHILPPPLRHCSESKVRVVVKVRGVRVKLICIFLLIPTSLQ